MHRRRRITLALALVAAVGGGACSDDALAELGGRSSDWIAEPEATTTTSSTTMPVVTRAAGELEWVNDSLVEGEVPPDQVLAAVFARSDGTSQYIQAARREIAAVLPEVEFPRVVPADIGFVSSQLVFNAGTLDLAEDPTVAFGLWSVEPYTRSRTVGQLATLTLVTDPAAEETEAGGEESCSVFADPADALCSVEEFEEHPIWRIEGETGLTLVWYGPRFRYELFARPGLEPDVVRRMIDTVTLADLVPSAAR